MPAPAHIGRHDLLCLLGGDLKRQPFVAVVEGLYRLCGDKLKQDGVACVQPAEQVAKDAQNTGVKHENIGPDGFSGLIGDIQRDKVRAAGGGVSLQGQHDADAHKEAAEHRAEQNIVKNRRQREVFQE